MPRIRLPTFEEMNPEQREVHDEVVAGPRGRLVGPLRAAIHSPKLASRWSKLGEYLRFSSCLPRKLNELAIITTGRRWNAQLEFQIHGEAARREGLSVEAVEAIRTAQPPLFAEAAEREIYEFTRQLQQDGNVADEVYRAIEARWGEQGLVELAAVIGYYTMVCMTLNVHEIPTQDGAPPPLAPVAGPGLTALPAARVA